MKMIKLLPILSLVFALVVSVAGVAAIGAPAAAQVDKGVQGTRLVGVSEIPAAEAELDIDGIYRVLMLNRLFGQDVYNEVALVEEAQIALLGEAEVVDGCLSLPRERVNGFIKELYGHTVKNSSDGEYYIIAARGFDPIGHVITDISTDNGKVVVTSQMRAGYAEPVEVVTVLSPSQNEFGYMILSADIV